MITIKAQVTCDYEGPNEGAHYRYSSCPQETNIILELKDARDNPKDIPLFEIRGHDSDGAPWCLQGPNGKNFCPEHSPVRRPR